MLHIYIVSGKLSNVEIMKPCIVIITILASAKWHLLSHHKYNLYIINYFPESILLIEVFGGSIKAVDL